MLWSSPQSATSEIMMPPPLIGNAIVGRRTSNNMQLIIPDNLKTEVLDENSSNSMLSDGLSSISTPTHSSSASESSPMQQVTENSLDSVQTNLLRTVGVPTNESPVKDAMIDLMRTQHNMNIGPGHQNSFSVIQESPQVKKHTPFFQSFKRQFRKFLTEIL